MGTVWSDTYGISTMEYPLWNIHVYSLPYFTILPSPTCIIVYLIMIATFHFPVFTLLHLEGTQPDTYKTHPEFGSLMAAPSRPWKPLNAPETSLPSFTIFYHLLPSFTIFYHLYPKLSHFLKTQLFYCFSVSDVDTMPDSAIEIKLFDFQNSDFRFPNFDFRFTIFYHSNFHSLFTIL